VSQPKLYVFAISHFCEKGRWTLDYLGIEHQVVFLAPGQHAKVAAQLGLKTSSLPFLDTGDEVIQGSDAILDWAETRSSNGRHLAPELGKKDCQEIEQRLGKIAGVHVRRYFYAEAIVDHPEIVRPVFTGNLPLLQKLIVSLGWGKIRKIMIKKMDLGPEQRVESRDIVDAELSWLDDLLSDGRQYLVGNEFSRADLSAASLLAPLVSPPQHPVYAGLSLPPLLAGEVAAWDQRASLQWVQRMYQEHRL
jgi:glutathione S-transferase